MKFSFFGKTNARCVVAATMLFSSTAGKSNESKRLMSSDSSSDRLRDYDSVSDSEITQQSSDSYEDNDNLSQMDTQDKNFWDACTKIVAKPPLENDSSVVVDTGNIDGFFNDAAQEFMFAEWQTNANQETRADSEPQFEEDGVRERYNETRIDSDKLREELINLQVKQEVDFGEGDFRFVGETEWKPRSLWLFKEPASKKTYLIHSPCFYSWELIKLKKNEWTELNKFNTISVKSSKNPYSRENDWFKITMKGISRSIEIQVWSLEDLMALVGCLYHMDRVEENDVRLQFSSSGYGTDSDGNSKPCAHYCGIAKYIAYNEEAPTVDWQYKSGRVCGKCEGTGREIISCTTARQNHQVQKGHVLTRPCLKCSGVRRCGEWKSFSPTDTDVIERSSDFTGMVNLYPEADKTVIVNKNKMVATFFTAGMNPLKTCKLRKVITQAGWKRIDYNKQQPLTNFKTIGDADNGMQTAFELPLGY